MKLNKELSATGIVIALSVIATVIFVVFLGKHISEVEAFIRNTGLLAPALMLVLHIVLAFTPIPTDMLSVISGALFGPIKGSFISWIGNNIAATIEYVIGRMLRNNKGFADKWKKLPGKINKFPVDSYWFLILARSIPQVGGKLVSFSAGIYEVPVQKYIWTTYLTNLIGSISFAYGGYGISRFFK